MATINSQSSRNHHRKAKLTENIGNPKDQWNALEKRALPSKSEAITNIFLQKGNKIKFDSKRNCKIFKELSAKLANDYKLRYQ